jgi:hypothetical protein
MIVQMLIKQTYTYNNMHTIKCIKNRFVTYTLADMQHYITVTNQLLLYISIGYFKMTSATNETSLDYTSDCEYILGLSCHRHSPHNCLQYPWG